MGGINLFVVIILTLSDTLGFNEPYSNTGEQNKAALRAKVEGQEPFLRAIHLKDQYQSYLTRRRIISGYVAIPHDYPFAAFLITHELQAEQDSRHYCSGSLITTKYVLTAAHCIERVTFVDVILGLHNIADDGPSILNLRATEFAVHDGYKGVRNDIGLIRLPHKVKLTKHIDTIEIAQGTDLYIGSIGRLLGWGKTHLSEIVSVELRYVDLEILSNGECAATGFRKLLQDHHLCGLGDGGGCFGDSGGPLIVDGIQVGVTAFVAKGCNNKRPTAFTRVTEFRSWILNETGKPSRDFTKAGESRLNGASYLKEVSMGMMCSTLLIYL